MFDISKTLNNLEITFTPVLENIDKAAEETKSFLIDLDKKQHAFNVVLVIREGLINAVMHGNKCDKNKKVIYSIKYNKPDLLIKIEDQGSGFDWKECMVRKNDSTKDCGRGLVIMQKYAISAQYNDIGNKLLLKMNVL